MSTETDTTGEDRLLRLLDDEGARWRAGYQPPSFDDAVRRLALPGDKGADLDDEHEAPTPAEVHVGWWRPALIAAAVLVLVGGALGAVAVSPGATRSSPGRTARRFATRGRASPPSRGCRPGSLSRPARPAGADSPHGCGAAAAARRIPDERPLLGGHLRGSASRSPGVHETLVLRAGVAPRPFWM